MRSSLKVLQFPSVLFALTVHNAEAFAHIWLKCTQKLLSVFSPLLSFGTPNGFHLLVLTFFLTYIKDEYFYTLKSKKTYQDQTTRSIYEIQNKKFGLNRRNIFINQLKRFSYKFKFLMFIPIISSVFESISWPYLTNKINVFGVEWNPVYLAERHCHVYNYERTENNSSVNHRRHSVYM